jgi:multiple sugar transport system ATP-binding protein
MMLMEAILSETNGGLSMQLGSQTLALPREVMDRRPALAGYLGRTLTVGIRPEDLQDATVNTSHPADRRLRATVDNVEALGFEVIAYFSIDATQVVSEDALELGEDAALPEIGTTRMTGRFDSSTRAAVGEPIEITVDTEKCHFFDLETGLAIRH